MITNPHTDLELSRFYHDKGLPYTPEVNLPTLANELEIAYQDICDLQAPSCPEDYAALNIIMHPEYASCRYYPQQLIEHLGFSCIGVQPADVYPRFSMSTGSTTLQEPTSQIRVAGKKSDIKAAAEKIKNLSSSSFVAKQACTVESFEAVSVYDRLDISSSYKDDLFLAGLFQFPGKDIAESRRYFTAFAKAHNFKVNENFKFEKDGMYYVLLKGKRADLDAVAEYAFLHKVRVPIFESDLYEELD